MIIPLLVTAVISPVPRYMPVNLPAETPVAGIVPIVVSQNQEDVDNVGSVEPLLLRYVTKSWVGFSTSILVTRVLEPSR